jgi:hypothetical protein
MVRERWERDIIDAKCRDTKQDDKRCNENKKASACEYIPQWYEPF